MKEGEKYQKLDGRTTEEYTVINIDKTETATWITVTDSKETTFYYGFKAFKSKFKSIK